MFSGQPAPGIRISVRGRPLLLFVGWIADILQYYAVFLPVGSALSVPDKLLLVLLATILAAAELHQLFIDYSQDWARSGESSYGCSSSDGRRRTVLRFPGIAPVCRQWQQDYGKGVSD
ncbi:hypothetical protein [Paenibacillus popilliae]|uniref:Predicted integral membrane protein n=1 Tax=Paenibacillus popilliae ATCC 14706 TaxID=1212764 RepID=M9M2X7_PAEPP|nr:hypothetical protein [Paenibacillus popilliae]GAC41538.1 predicted integral membrane protein [Paenibacillus popilliae ATCC 14706]